MKYSLEMIEMYTQHICNIQFDIKLKCTYWIDVSHSLTILIHLKLMVLTMLLLKAKMVF